jgi:hypothetical protein
MDVSRVADMLDRFGLCEAISNARQPSHDSTSIRGFQLIHI